MPSKPDYSAFSAFGSSHPPSQSTTPQPSLFQQQQAAAAAKKQSPPVDPFAALASPVRQSTPQKPQPSMFDFANPKPATPTPSAPAADDDEWAFASALPDASPATNTFSVSDTSLNIVMHAAREPATPSIITLSVTFSNKTSQPISELTFMAAVSKVNPPAGSNSFFTNIEQSYTLKLQPQSGRRLQPIEQAGVTQVIYLLGVEHGKGDTVKLRWKASYKVGPSAINEQGEISSLGIA